MLMSPVANAAGQCPAGESGCTIDNAATHIQERVNEGARKVLRNESPAGRANEVKNTASDCLNCGLDALRDGVKAVK
jgi:hypothetical protein